MSDARILDAGYRRYAGTRLGPGHSVRSVIANTLRRILGLRRPARSKVLPFLTIVFSYVPATVYVGVVAVLNSFGVDPQELQSFVPQYVDYYTAIILAIVLFVTFVAPEALCTDRRYRVLSLYLASPLTRMTYLLGKAAAVAAALAIVTIGPELLLLFGFSLQGFGPDGVLGFLGMLGRIVAAGVVLAIFYTALTIGVASLTDRRAIAAAATMLLVIGSNIVANILRFGLGMGDEVLLLSLTIAPFEVTRYIYGESSLEFDFPLSTIVLGNLAWIALGAGIAVVRYRRLQVTR